MSRRFAAGKRFASIGRCLLVLLAMLTAGGLSRLHLLSARVSPSSTPAWLCDRLLIASASLDFAVSPIAPKQPDDSRLAEESERKHARRRHTFRSGGSCSTRQAVLIVNDRYREM